MLHTIRTNMQNVIQVAAEVNAALRENTLVVVTKRQESKDSGYPLYDIYAGQGKVEGYQVKED